MCFDFDAVPPDLPSDGPRGPAGAAGRLPQPRPRGGGPAAAGLLALEAGEGPRSSAAFAGAPESSGPAVVIYPDVRGLYPFYIQLAERFAEGGQHALTMKFFARTPGLVPRGEDFDYVEHVPQTRSTQVQADTKAALGELRERSG